MVERLRLLGAEIGERNDGGAQVGEFQRHKHCGGIDASAKAYCKQAASKRIAEQLAVVIREHHATSRRVCASGWSSCR
jgi:hypothetical protein